jgi:transposase InsO family protein
MIEYDLSQVEETATKFTYRLSVGSERCEDKGEKSAPKFIHNSTYHKEEATIKPTKTRYSFNPKPTFNPKREARKETHKPREKVFICIFCDRAGHLDEFCFRRKKIERRCDEYGRNSYRDEFIDFPPRSYSHFLPRFYSWASPHTVSPSWVRSMGDKWYVLVIIDNYFRYSWVFFLESKNEVFENFQSLALRLNNEHPNCLKAIHSDNGTEFRNTSFDKFCLEHDIDQQFSAPRVPQQNGVMERKNHTLVEMARMMLDEHRTLRLFGSMLLALLVISLIESSYARFCI